MDIKKMIEEQLKKSGWTVTAETDENGTIVRAE